MDKVVATMHRKGAEALAVAYAAAGASATGWRCREGRRACSSSNRLGMCLWPEGHVESRPEGAWCWEGGIKERKEEPPRAP